MDNDVIAELIAGGGLVGAGAKTVYDVNRLAADADNWLASSNETAEKLRSTANTFVSPVSGKKYIASPEDIDLDHKVYYNNANKVLNRRLLGMKVGNLYDLPIQFGYALEQLQNNKADQPVYFDGLFGNSRGRTHNQFQMGNSQKESLAHFLRDYGTKGGPRNIIFSDTEAKRKVPKFLLNWAKKVKANPGSFTQLAPLGDGKAWSMFKNYVYNAPKGIRLTLANAIAGSDKTTHLSDFIKKLGVTEDNFSFSTVYNKLAEAYKNETDPKFKKKLGTNIRLLEKMMLSKVPTTDGGTFQWARKFSEDLGPHYAKSLNKALGYAKKPLFGLAALLGAGGAGLLGHGIYRNSQQNIIE